MGTPPPGPLGARAALALSTVLTLRAVSLAAVGPAAPVAVDHHGGGVTEQPREHEQQHDHNECDDTVGPRGHRKVVDNVTTGGGEGRDGSYCKSGHVTQTTRAHAGGAANGLVVAARDSFTASFEVDA